MKSQTLNVALSALCANNSESLLGGIRTRQHTALRLGSPQHSTLRLGDPQHSTLRLGSTQHSTLNPGQPSALKTQTRQHSALTLRALTPWRDGGSTVAGAAMADNRFPENNNNIRKSNSISITPYWRL